MQLSKAHLRLPKDHTYSGMVTWRSPSNIALVKYWGKRPVQLPANASLSFTLSEAHTTTSVSYTPRASELPWIDFYFDGKREPSFAERIEHYFSNLSEVLPFLGQLHFMIRSENSFPHSSGIASSASSMSALALALCDIEHQIFQSLEDTSVMLKQASYIARLGSGSASRSVYPKLAAWGESPHIIESSDEFAIQISGLHPVYETFHDDVLIVSESKKSVSSSAGHALMDTNIFAASRYRQANDHMRQLLDIMKSDDLHAFGKIVEDEALTLHALMMCSDPSYILIEPNTLQVIKAIRTYRKKTNLPVFFTLDAGPNVHILYPNHIAQEIRSFISTELVPFAKNQRIITDKVGEGPIKLK